MRESLRDKLIVSHTPEQVKYRLQQNTAGSYLKDFVLGAIDGAVTTFAVVSGIAGANLEPKIIIIMGFANLLADGFSMAVSNYLGVSTENQQRNKIRLEEEMHINIYPEGEKEEIRQIFARKGFVGDSLEEIVKIITANKGLWEDTMLQEEYGLQLEGSIAWKAAFATFSAFLLIGFIPIFPFLWNYISTNHISNPFFWSSLITGFAFFMVGAIKSQFVSKPWYVAGTETLLLGGSAASLAYLIGNLLKDLN